MSKYLVSLLLLLSLPAHADTLKFNPFTNNLDITGSASSGSGGIVSPATFTWQNTFGMSVSTLTLTSAPSGAVIFSSTSGKLFQDNSLLHWDDSLGFLGIGTATPNHTLHIQAFPNTTPLRIAYNDDIYMDVTQGGSVFNMKDVGSTRFLLNNQTVDTNASFMSLSSNGDIVLSEESNPTALTRLIVNSAGTGFRAGDSSDTNYLDYQSGGVLSGFISTGFRPLQFGANSVYSLFISGDHNLGVNCSTPGTALQLSSGTFTIDGNVSPAIKIKGSGAPPDAQALCLSGGALGHCTTVVGATGGCTCSVP